MNNFTITKERCRDTPPSSNCQNRLQKNMKTENPISGRKNGNKDLPDTKRYIVTFGTEQ
jgi:hypothetical protein